MEKMSSNDFVEAVKNMTVLELSNVVKALEDEFGVVAAAPMAAAPAAVAEVVEEKSAFDVVLTSAGDSKIGVIKEVKAFTGLGLKEAKELVDSAPKVLKEGVPTKEAEEIKQKLVAAGATVDLK